MAFKLRLHRRHERHGARPLCNAHRGHHPLAARQPHRQSGQQPVRARARGGGQSGADRDGRGHRRGRVLKAQKDAATRRRLGGRRGHDRLVRAGDHLGHPDLYGERQCLCDRAFFGGRSHGRVRGRVCRHDACLPRFGQNARRHPRHPPCGACGRRALRHRRGVSRLAGFDRARQLHRMGCLPFHGVRRRHGAHRSASPSAFRAWRRARRSSAAAAR